jgi:hypothetical protein
MYCFNIVTSKKHLKNNYYLTLKHSSKKKTKSANQPVGFEIEKYFVLGSLCS